MASATPLFEVGAEVLGYVGLVATWRRSTTPTGQRGHTGPMLTIQQSASTDESASDSSNCGSED
jgi:hypothetical protein